MPKITIALLVYNEERFLDETLQSVLRQSFKDFEIIIGNNASTDNSTKIIEKYAKKDSRIIHIKRTKNIGALQNWNDLVDKAQGKYFIFAGGHDKWTPNYLLQLNRELDENKKAVLSFAKTQWIDQNGQEIDIPTTLVDTSGLSRMGKFVSIMFSNQHYLMGLIRINELRKTRKSLEVIGSGEILLQELVQRGDFVLVENERWFRRIIRDENTGEERLERYRKTLSSDELSSFRFFFLPHFQMLLVYLGFPFVLKGVSLQFRISLLLVYPLIFYRHWSGILLDFRWGAKKILRVLSK